MRACIIIGDNHNYRHKNNDSIIYAKDASLPLNFILDVDSIVWLLSNEHCGKDKVPVDETSSGRSTKTIQNLISNII